MRFRKLRIAWSAACGIVCLLLIMLWARSFVTWDHITIPTSDHAFSVWNGDGQLSCIYYPSTSSDDWSWTSHTVETSKNDKDSSGNRGWGFNLFWEYAGKGGWVPHWFLIVTVGAVVGLPWITRLRRFSLRTLLIATTLVAVVLGLAVYVARK